MQIPKIKALPILGNAPELSKDILGFLGKNFKEQGDTFLFSMPINKTLLATCDAEVIKQILQLNHKNYRKDYGNNILKLALGNGLLTNEGESWFRQRRLAQPAFYKKRLEGFFDSMNTITIEHIQQLKAKGSKELFIDKEMMQLTSKVVIETLLGADVLGKLGEVQNYIYSIQDHLVKLIRVPFYQLWGKNYWKRERLFEDAGKI